jgi:hypothetical protein
VGARECRVEKTMRIEDRQHRRHEHVLHDLQAGLGGAGAIGMSAHAVEHEHNRGFVRDNDSGTVLVVLPVTECGNFCVFDLHSGVRLECSAAETYHGPA